MKKNTFVCIAGKNNVACDSLSFLVDSGMVPKEMIMALPNSGKDVSWMKSLRNTARKNGVKLLDEISQLYKIRNLIFISLEYDKIIDVSRFASKELFNIHFSKLPAYKGCYTSAWPILNGEEESGVTLHVIDSGIDTGDSIDQIVFPVRINATARDLYFRYNSCAFELFKKNISSLLNKKYDSFAQPSRGGSYYSRHSLDFGNLHISLDGTAFQLHNRVRAFIFPEYQLPEVCGHRIIKSEITGRPSTKKTGSIVSENKKFIEIATIDYNVRLFKG